VSVIKLHEPALADYIGGQNGGKAALSVMGDASITSLVSHTDNCH
jgi:hypothetical protein